MEMQQRAAAKRAELGLGENSDLSQELRMSEDIAIPDLPEFGATEDLPALPGESSVSGAYYHANQEIDASMMVAGGSGQADQTADLDSFSDITDLEEMDTNEREIIKLDGGTPLLGSDMGDDDSLDSKHKRNRRPRPPRRFKTALTRIRPKLEAAIGPPEERELNTDEEGELLEQERKRRKK